MAHATRASKYSFRIAIIGFGSIGKRHYRNLLSCGIPQTYIVIYDPRSEHIKEFPHLSVQKTSTIPFQNFDIVFICSPTNLHIKHALSAIQAGCHVFIEKPLSHSMKDVKKMISLVRKKRVVTMVGCNMRFHPCILAIKKVLDKKTIGKIYSINHEYGQYLPFWRPHQDYRKGYAAKKTTGGGVIFDEMHEFDLLFWMNNFKPVRKSKFIFDKVSSLQIHTEDICFATFQFANKVLGLIRVDYLQKSYSRTAKIVGEKGNIEWDFTENIVWMKSKNKKQKLFQIKNYDVNQMFIDEILYFLDCVKKKKKTSNNVETAVNVLSYCVERK